MTLKPMGWCVPCQASYWREDGCPACRTDDHKQETTMDLDKITMAGLEGTERELEPWQVRHLAQLPYDNLSRAQKTHMIRELHRAHQSAMRRIKELEQSSGPYACLAPVTGGIG